MFKKKVQSISEPQLNETTKEIVFEAMIHRVDAPAIFYYVEKDGDKFYFKSGVSILGARIRPDEDNRLNIDIKSRFHYEALKNKLIEKFHTTKYIGALNCSTVWFNFPTESHTPSKDDIVVNSNVLTSIEFEFDIELDMRLQPINYVVCDSFSVNTKLYKVIHNKNYDYDDTAMFDFCTDSEREDLKLKYQQVFETQENNKITNDAIIKTVVYGYGDLLKEALFINQTLCYPKRMIVVHGWTSRDLIEMMDMSICEAYYMLSMMRSSPTDCKERLRYVLAEYWPKLFEKEIELDNMVKENAQNDSASTTIDFSSRRKSTMALKKSALSDLHKQFLSKYTIPDIENELKKYVIGQDNLVQQVALFVYYHILRQVKPELHNRPMLISGPSGSGKTEVWRVVKKIYKDYLRVEIVDGSSITQDGWSGQRKLATCLESLDTAAIFVVDEFDKLASPSFSKGGDNVSHHIQSEFLKLLEGDYTTTGIKAREEIMINYDCSTLGIVLVGAFEKVRNEKEQDGSKIGFIQRLNPEYNQLVEISDEDLVDFGVMPEIVGRIASKCTTNKLTAQQYLEIIRNENSKVSVLLNELQGLGIDASDCITDDIIMELTSKSQINLLGVRWVSSQIENLLLQKLAHSDIRELFKDTGTKFIDAAAEINSELDSKLSDMQEDIG